MELQNWDGAKQRLICGQALGPLEVVNVSAVTLSNVPVLIEGPRPAAGWLRKLAPGQTAQLPPPAADWTTPARLELAAKGVTWSCSRKDGSLFDRIQAGDLVLGRLVFAVHQRADGQDQWSECDRSVSLRMQEQPDAWLVEAVVGRGEAGSRESFRAGVRAAVFKQGGLVLARPLWVENTGARGWRMLELFWFCRPAMGGSLGG